ncbi:MAG: hydrogenase iron-sulfur subunit [Nitrospinae bacterium]|nr:hydrogenase iron-sulfur subunit [Nitrospinota bacterium]
MSEQSENKKNESNGEWEPKIIAFVCNWCTYVGADMAGTGRMKYQANVRIIKVPCTGRIDPLFLMRAFERGADGILVSGCHPGDCHYNAGNYHARRRFAAFRKLIEFIGIDLRRLQFSWVSAAEGKKFVTIINEVTDAIRALGPCKEYQSMALEPPKDKVMPE